MAEIRAADDKYIDQIPTIRAFKLPADFGKAPEAPKPDISQEKPAAPPTEAEAAPSTESATVTEGADKEQAEPQTTAKAPEKPEVSPRRLERRIDRATKARAEAEAKAEAYAKELAELKSKQAPAVDPQAPKMADYTDIEEYAKATADYAVKQETKSREEKAQQTQVQASRKALLDSWTEASVKGEDKFEDFAEVVGDLQPTAPWSIAIMKSENAPEVAYYLGKHLKEAQRISSLDPVSQIFEIGKLSLKLSQAPVAPKQPSKAPAPIAPVGATTTSGEPAVNDAMPIEQYMKVGAKAFRGRS